MFRPVVGRASFGAVLSLAVGLGAAVDGQSKRARDPVPSGANASVVDRAPGLDDSTYRNVANGLHWRSVGPAVMSGRISSVAVFEKQPQVIYVASASGGLWKTTNHGTTFQPVFDNESTISIGDVAVAQFDPNLVWVGTGESNNRNSSSWGDGVYKSTDGGQTWTNTGLKDTRHIGRIVLHPSDPNIVYVAAAGHLWGYNKERGVFKTTDGGRTWSPSLQVDEKTGAIDLTIDPSDPNTLYAAMFQRLRTPYSYQATGSGSGIYKTTDAGKTWRKLTNGLPASPLGRVGLAVYRKNPQVVYAVVECDTGGQYVRVDAPSVEGGIFRSDDKGETWHRRSSFVPRPFYHGQIRIDPNDEQKVWVLGGSIYASDDGGGAFRNLGRGPDHHALWIDPSNSSHMVNGNDNGFYISYDYGANWTRYNTFPLGQYYGVGVDMRKPYYIYGGLQDNGVFGGPSRTTEAAGITNADVWKLYYGDGINVQVDPTDPYTVYADWHGGYLARIDLHTGRTWNIRPEPKEGTQDLRYNWQAPLVMSSHNPRRLYFGANRLIRIDDGGERWSFISPDLTTNDRSRIPAVVWREGSPGYAWSAEMHCTITTIAESPLKEGLIWVGTDDGNVQLTTDGGETWTDVAKSLGAPQNSWISRVEASHFDEKAAYVTVDDHRTDDLAPYVYMTTDSGKTWTPLRSNLPSSGPVYVIREDRRNSNLLFVGTEYGVFTSLDRGRTWGQLKSGLPTVAVYDMVIHPRDNDLVIGTHGRSIYVLDIAPLQELTQPVLTSAAHLFDVKSATLFQYTNTRDWQSQGNQMYAAPNPPFGAVINYYLGQPMSSDVTVTVTDKRNTFTRRFSGRGYAGINQVVWDLRMNDGAPRAEQRTSEFHKWPEYAAGLVSPGEYLATLNAGGVRMTKTIVVEAQVKTDRGPTSTNGYEARNPSR